MAKLTKNLSRKELINKIQMWAYANTKQELKGVEFTYTIPAMDLDIFLEDLAEEIKSKKKE